MVVIEANPEEKINLHECRSGLVKLRFDCEGLSKVNRCRQGVRQSCYNAIIKNLSPYEATKHWCIRNTIFYVD